MANMAGNEKQMLTHHKRCKDGILPIISKANQQQRVAKTRKSREIPLFWTIYGHIT